MCNDTANRVLQSSIVVIAALSINACATHPAGTSAERAVDDQLAAQVDRALSADPNIYARHIDVSVEHGVIHLSGFVWSAEDFYEAKRVAAMVPGVTSVHSQLDMVVGGKGSAR
jgi:osmotically-inducible protein OsmY